MNDSCMNYWRDSLSTKTSENWTNAVLNQVFPYFAKICQNCKQFQIMSNNLKNWTIKDSFFYPLGLFNNASRNKTVFVAWGYNTLFTYIFKKSNLSNSLKDSFKILLHGTILDIVATELNTLCLTTAGFVYYFSSCKSLKRLEFLEGVRCITATGNGFAVIKVTKQRRIMLETYKDFTEGSKIGPLRKSFDISFDEENMFNSSWTHDNFLMTAVAVTNENRKFLGLVAKGSISGSEIFLFAINNSLFGLIGDKSVDEAETAIFLIHTLPSEIGSVRFASEYNAILIFMKCGVLEVIFYSNISKTLSRAVHVIDANMIAFTISENIFFCSDGMRVIKYSLFHDNNKDTIALTKSENCISGIVALTWVSTMRKLICLSENNIFYRLKFNEMNVDNDSDEEFSELNEEKIREVETHFARLFVSIDEPHKIRKQIKDECHKQELMQVIRRSEMFMNLIDVKIGFCAHLPKFEGHVIYPISEKVLTRKTYFALVNVAIKPNLIFKTCVWKLFLEIISDTHSFKSITLDPVIIETPLKIMLQLERSDTLIIPEVRVSVTAIAKVEQEMIYVSIPAKISVVEFEKLFSKELRSLVDPKSKTTDEKIAFIKQQNTKQSVELPLNFSSRIKTPLLLSIEEIYESFGISLANKPNNECLASKLDMHLLGIKIEIEYFEMENMIVISSFDPGALFYAKKFLATLIYSDLYNDKHAPDTSLQLLHKLKAELDAKYNSSTDIKSLIVSLKKFYWNLRKDTLTKI